LTVDEPRWLGIEPRHLATLRAVAESGSFRGAAAELGYVPSAVSAHIGALERTVGRPLVLRRRGAGVELTDAGHVLLGHAEAILGRLRAAQADMTALADDRSAPLRVGITQSVGIRALPDIVRRFGQEWPTVRIQPRESETDLELYGGVEQAELDLSFVELPAPRPGEHHQQERTLGGFLDGRCADGQDRAHHRESQLATEKREHTHGNQNVVQKRHDCADRKGKFEAERHENQDPNDPQAEGDQRILRQLAADQSADSL